MQLLAYEKQVSATHDYDVQVCLVGYLQLSERESYEMQKENMG